jgi:hypothetical protein
MIARIIADGTLAIEAETELETYALARWKEDFDRRRVTLKIILGRCCPVSDITDAEAQAALDLSR